jgi:hypothetical protein
MTQSSKTLFLALTLCLSASPGQAETHTQYGAGLLTCGDWLRSRTEQDNKLMDQFFTSWMQGYLTALDAQRVKIRQAGNSELLDWLLGYCQQHPQANFETAVLELARELGHP